MHARLLMILTATSVLMAQLAPARAYSLYTPAEIEKDAGRLEGAVTKLLNIGLRPVFTRKEQDALARVTLVFPRPEPGDDLLNFYAGHDLEGGKVFLPLQSLKLLEDLTTAFAWLYVENKSFEPIDLYFAMLRNKTADQYDGGRPPGLLAALRVPSDALDNPKVDRLALGLRNEAFAFLLAHELGHVLYRHKGYDQITVATARADEVQSDAFALDVLARTGTAPMGAVLFFQAQMYALPHRGEFRSSAEWETYLATASTHPMSVDRLKAMATMIAGPLARSRPAERLIWMDIAMRLEAMTLTLSDVELYRCIAKIAASLPLDRLAPRPHGATPYLTRNCEK